MRLLLLLLRHRMRMMGLVRLHVAGAGRAVWELLVLLWVGALVEGRLGRAETGADVAHYGTRGQQGTLIDPCRVGHHLLCCGCCGYIGWPGYWPCWTKTGPCGWPWCEPWCIIMGAATPRPGLGYPLGG